MIAKIIGTTLTYEEVCDLSKKNKNEKYQC